MKSPTKSPRGPHKPRTSSRRIGRPPFLPTIEQRQDVCLLKAAGWTHQRIARRLAISIDSLERHFRHELDYGADQEKHRALQLLRGAADAGNVSAIKEYARFVNAASAIDEFLAQPEKTPAAKQPKLGKKELAREDALRAHVDSEWGEDLAPLGEHTIN